MYRSSRSQVFFKIGVLKYFADFKGKHLCWSPFLTKFLTNFIKKTLQCRCFPVKFTKFFRRPFSTEHLWWLLLHVMLSVVYKATSTTSSNSFVYYGTSEGEFKTRYNNHTKSFRHRECMNETELSKHVWNLKDNGLDNNLS